MSDVNIPSSVAVPPVNTSTSPPLPDVDLKALQPAMLTSILSSEAMPAVTKEEQETPLKVKEIHLSKTLWNKKSVKLGIVALVFVMVLTGTIAAITISAPSTPDFCDEFLKDPSSQEKPLLRQICRQSKCPFKISLCSFYCPLGYAAGEDGCPVSCMCAAKSRTYQSDIYFDPHQLPGILGDYGLLDDEGEGFSVYFGSAASNIGIWLKYDVDGRYQIPYSLDSDAYSEEDKEYFSKHFQVLSNYTCIDFPIRTTESAYIYIFINGEVCGSYLGRVFEGQQIANFHHGCFYSTTLEHEMTHALGFYHEQARNDRDDYVRIHKENIIEQQYFNFEKLRSSDAYNLGLKFDFSSMMLYESLYFSKNGEYTITKVDNDEEIVVVGLSELDMEGIRRLYQCSGTYPVISPIAAADFQTYENGSTGYQWGEWSGLLGCEGCQTEKTGWRIRYCQGGHLTFCEKEFPKDKYYFYLKCNLLCDDNAIWQDWGEWSSCSRNQKSRARNCSGSICEGWQFQDEPCLERGVSWYEWGAWEPCTSCNSGSTRRTRSCNGGSTTDCHNYFVREDSKEFEDRECSTLPCNDGTWGQWKRWQKCSLNCGGGMSLRHRICSSPGRCVGIPYEARRCNTLSCSDEARWSKWTVIHSQCQSKRRGGRVKVKSRTCIPMPNRCPGGRYRVERCSSPVLFSEDDEALPIFVSPPTPTTAEVLCQAEVNSTWTFGDFNGDGVDDAICRRNNGTYEIGLGDASNHAPERSWIGEIATCSGDTRLSADFNGDGKDDLLCQDKLKKSLSVVLSSEGSFLSEPIFEDTFCTEDKDEVVLLDSNGNGKTDIICRRKGTGFSRVYNLNL